MTLVCSPCRRLTWPLTASGGDSRRPRAAPAPRTCDGRRLEDPFFPARRAGRCGACAVRPDYVARRHAFRQNRHAGRAVEAAGLRGPGGICGVQPGLVCRGTAVAVGRRGCSDDVVHAGLANHAGLAGAGRLA
ncbi:hypothetical protein [Ornithinimicrobium kibberense]|uniref:hypothetical protein n=1 Tax=Ornithinimicrobium kibberense TaxID=282060 RepID=UPI00361B18D6